MALFNSRHLAAAALAAAITLASPAAEIDAGSANVPADDSGVTADRPKHREEIEVLAEQIGGRYSPHGLSAVAKAPTDLPAPPGTVAEIAADASGVSENGQGGLFQVVSVRGVSGHRVLHLISGMRLTTERRAGIASSFLDATLIGEIDVLRGPASTYYGSGALGGAIEVDPRHFERLDLSAGYDSAGGAGFQSVGWGNAEWSLGLAHRSTGDTATPDGARRFDRFDQTSAALRRSWPSSGHLESRLEVIPSRGRDIGKPSSDFPARATIYPEENHLLVRYSLAAGERWRAHAFLHPNDLETRVTQAAAVQRVENESFDLGAGWERALRFSPAPESKMDGRIGVDYIGRRGVDAIEAAIDPVTGPIERAASLRDAEEDELAAFAIVNWGLERVRIETGARTTRVRQSNDSLPSAVSDSMSGFASAGASLGRGLELIGNVGTGERVPSLTERFFTGTTGRGQVIGNPELDRERSLNTELALRYGSRRLSLAASIYRNEIDDYVERVTLGPGLTGHRNLTDGTIEGFDLDLWVEPVRLLRVDLGLHRVEGAGDAGQALADIPPSQLRLAVSRSAGRWRFMGRLRYRLEKEPGDVGDGEQPIPDAWVLEASVGRELRSGLELLLHGRNLLDETYFPSADELAMPAAERSLGVALRWHR